MSSPGGEETGEGGQFYALGAHILTRGKIVSHTHSYFIIHTFLSLRASP